MQKGVISSLCPKFRISLPNNTNELALPLLINGKSCPLILFLVIKGTSVFWKMHHSALLFCLFYTMKQLESDADLLFLCPWIAVTHTKLFNVCEILFLQVNVLIHSKQNTTYPKSSFILNSWFQDTGTPFVNPK